MSIRIGIDLGGTKTALVALEGSAVRHEARMPTPAHDYDAILDTVQTLVSEAERALGVRASVGVGTPGAIAPGTGTLKNSNTPCLNGRSLDRDLAGRLGRAVRIQNDANCFALSEASDGAGRGASVVFGVILGTGTGGGLVVRGEVITGRNAIAGEWGHNPLPWPNESERPGPPCYCGRSGCIETFSSGTGLARDHEREHGEKLRAEEIVARAAGGDVRARASMERYYDRLARALASVVNLLDPDVIVLGGGLSQVDALYTEVPARLRRYVFSDRVDTQLLPPVHGDASGVRGAARLWP